MAGIVFAKMTRAKQRAQTLLFSKHAVICQRDGNLSLMFRVGDMRKSHIIGAGVRAQLIRTRSTKEGEVMTQYFTELQIGTDDSGSDLFFIWPMVIEHRIDENSPLYNMNATDMLQDKFEIVVLLEGTVESTGQSTQARSSYINTEILWGHRFDPVVLYNKDLQAYEIDYSRFNETTQVDTPLCSARELNEIYKIQEGFRTPGKKNKLAVIDVTFLMLLVHCHCRDNLYNASAVHQSFRSGFISFCLSSMFCLSICCFSPIVRNSPFVQVSS